MIFSEWILFYLMRFYQWMALYLHSRLRSSVPPDATATNELIQGVHCLRDPPAAKFDVVFLSGPKTKWYTQDEEECWPLTWVPETFPLARVLIVDTPPLNFWEAAINLINSLVAEQVSLGSRPFFLIAHSVGGLLLKELMSRADKPPFRDIGVGSNCRGVVFYDVPHLGGKEAEKKAMCTQFGLSMSQVDDICSHECFRRNLEYRPIEYPALYFIGRYEKQVSPESAALGSDASNSVFVKCKDHFEVCKPKKKTDLIFAKLEEFVREHMDAGEHQVQDRSKEYVGLNDKVKAVSGLIAKGAAAIEVVSLNGMGGVGKTTLGREVVDHIRKGYAKFAWVEVTATPNVVELQDKLAKGLSIELHGADPIHWRNEMRTKLKNILGNQSEDSKSGSNEEEEVAEIAKKKFKKVVQKAKSHKKGGGETLLNFLKMQGPPWSDREWMVFPDRVLHYQKDHGGAVGKGQLKSAKKKWEGIICEAVQQAGSGRTHQKVKKKWDHMLQFSKQVLN